MNIQIVVASSKEGDIPYISLYTLYIFLLHAKWLKNIIHSFSFVLLVCRWRWLLSLPLLSVHIASVSLWRILSLPVLCCVHREFFSLALFTIRGNAHFTALFCISIVHSCDRALLVESFALRTVTEAAGVHRDQRVKPPNAILALEIIIIIIIAFLYRFAYKRKSISLFYVYVHA